MPSRPPLWGLAIGAGALVALTGAWLALGRSPGGSVRGPAETAPGPAAVMSVGTATAAASACTVDGCSAPDVSVDPMMSGALIGKPALVEFSSDYCQACAEMKPILSGVAHSCDAKSSIVRVDVEDERGQSLVAHYGVKVLPTFISVDANGHEISRLVGSQPRERLALALGAVRGSACPLL